MEIQINNKQYRILNSKSAEKYTSAHLEANGFLPIIYVIIGKRKALHIAYQTKNGNFVLAT